ncbi:MAG: LytR/AlgR family response regulator transcription factor [Spirochaetota bacterium]
MSPVSIILVEANEEFRNLIAAFIREHPVLELRGMAQSEIEVEACLSGDTSDVILYNPNIPGLGGLNFVRKFMLKRFPKPLFVTIILRGQSVVEALSAGAVDCLELPVTRSQFEGMITRIQQRLRESSAYRAILGSLSVRTGRGIRRIRLHDIIYLSGTGKKTIIHTLTEDVEVATLLKDAVASIQSQTFCRIHKRYVANLNYFACLRYDAGGRYILELRGVSDLVLPVGAIFAQELRKRLGLRKVSSPDGGKE